MWLKSGLGNVRVIRNRICIRHLRKIPSHQRDLNFEPLASEMQVFICSVARQAKGCKSESCDRFHRCDPLSVAEKNFTRTAGGGKSLADCNYKII